MAGVCYAFQRGECTRGDGCRFSHDLSGADGDAPRRRTDRPAGICYAFQRGECDRGDGCRFSHDNSGSDNWRGRGGDAPRGRPAPGGYGSRPSGGSNVCYKFQRGECDRGDSCRFSHDASGASAPAPRSDRPRGVCYSFQKGECTRGDSCRFSHEVEGY